MNEILNLIVKPEFLYGVMRLSTPLLFAALAALVAKQCGITNMAIEGTMLFAALFGVVGSAYWQSAFIGVLCAVAIAVVISLILAYFKINMQADELLVAIALNLLAAGSTVFLLFIFTGERGNSSSLNSKVVPSIDIPLIKDIPYIGKVLSGHNLLVYISFISAFLIYILLYKTAMGLRIRAVGGNIDAASSVGVSIKKVQYLALIISGILAGLGGAYMSMGYMSVFSRSMTAGRGFIGLAAANIASQNPIGALVASLIFGFFDTLGNNMQQFNIPVQFIYMIPYVSTIIAYAISSYRKKTAQERKAKKLAYKNAVL
ncbi:MAG: ABC transporter permease [Bacilli bacterium]